ncbi:MAG: AbrB/MazE/SpoVT family DNA-binding domain-containing protein [Verrucomicrobia bacterium]|nr:AbrB/MazE/SpoVT family DNA-binding domain-containing protein [Verrucomicrobiota bacterium]
MTLTLDKMGRFVVPKQLRDRFCLKPGDELEVLVESDGIKLRPVQPTSAMAMENGILVCTSEVPASAWDISEFLKNQREERSQSLGGM